jgi:hypothetical protein
MFIFCKLVLDHFITPKNSFKQVVGTGMFKNDSENFILWNFDDLLGKIEE